MNRTDFFRFYIFVVLSCICASVFSQNVIGFDTNSFRQGDKIDKQEICFFPQGPDGENIIWNFSETPIVGEYPIEYICEKDSFVTASLEPICINKYVASTDTLKLIGFETALEYLNYNPSIVMCTYPFHFGDSICTPFKGEGVYCGTNSIQTRGIMTVIADAHGSIVLSQGDTISNVLRVHSIKSSSVNMNILNDTTVFDSDNLKQVIEERYQWYARGFRYPLFETINTTCYNNMVPVTNLKKAYYSLPQEQRLLRNTTNEDSGNQDSLNSQQVCDNADIISYSVDINGSSIIISYSLTEDANISTLLCNQMGVTFQNASLTMHAGECYQNSFNTNGLRSGIYILYINVNGKVYSEKVNLKWR